MVEDFGSFRAKELELRTTIAYVWNMIEGTEQKKAIQVTESVSQLKPHFNKSEIGRALDELKERKVISYASEL